MTLQEAIVARHSVRSYLDRKIDPETVSLLQTKIEALNRSGEVRLQFLEDAGNTFNRMLSRLMGLGSAPSVIACVAKDTPDAEQLVGYYGQQLVLYAQTIGLNTCWAGTFNAKNVPAKVADDERLIIVIAIGYGRDQGKPHRSKRYDQVAKCDLPETPEWFKKGVEAALWAPTAINQQHFLIRLNPDMTVAIADLGGPFSRVDCGIVRCNFEIGAGKLK